LNATNAPNAPGSVPIINPAASAHRDILEPVALVDRSVPAAEVEKSHGFPSIFRLNAEIGIGIESSALDAG